MLARFLRRRLQQSEVELPDVGALADVIASSVVTVVNRTQRTWSASNGESDAMQSTVIGLEMLRDAFGTLVDPRSDATPRPTVIVMNTEGVMPTDVVKRLNSIFDPD